MGRRQTTSYFENRTLPSVAPKRISFAATKPFHRFDRSLALFKESSVDVIESIQFLPRNFLTDIPFDIQHCFEFFGDYQGESVSHLFGSSGAPDPVDVVFGMQRNIVID